MIIEHNVETGNIIEREMNAEELKQWNKDIAEAEAAKAEAAQKAANRAALLSKLGITEDEARLLLGGN
jgi:predicted nucleic acid-binding Zn ribbon protein